jgi:hypothetical protein
METHNPVKRPEATILSIETITLKKYGIQMNVNDTYSNIQAEIFVTCAGGLVQGDAVSRTKSPFSPLCIQTIKFAAARGVVEYEREQGKK